MSDLTIKDLNFYYGSFQALKSVNMVICKGEITAFIGPSGCGKSTLLRTINRIYELYPNQKATGSIFLGDENILETRDVNKIRARIGMVFQKPTPFPMSIFDNIAFGVKLYEKLGKSEMAERVEWALKEAALWNEVKNKLRQSGLGLSGGQQQRLCIARAIAIKPEVFLMDEPTAALDPISTALIEELMSGLKREYTIVIVTHNMQQAGRISNRTAFMYEGEVVEYDKTETIFTNPRNKLTERYITGHFG